MQDSTAGQNPNANFFQPGQGGNPNLANPNPTIQAPPVPTTTDASKLGSNPISLNPAPTPSMNGVSSNTGVPAPIASAESIINQGVTATPAEQKQQSVLDRIAGLISGNKTKTTLQNDAEQATGVLGAKTAVNDLNTQLEGLNNQATALQNEANYTIPNQAQLDAIGKGITSAGLQPITASQLRANQIKQGAIATQSLTVKSALYGAQGKLSLAQDAADKAATAQYEQQQQQIDAYKAQLDALAPTLSKEEKAQAAIVQAQLQDRQTQIDNAKEDKKSIIAMATAALTNNPNDPQAQYAAQQALAESNKPQPDLQKALGLIGQYQKDPTAVAQAIATLTNTRANTAKTNADIAKTSAETNALNNSNPANTPPPDVTSQSILAQTGLPIQTFNYLTQGQTALSRMPAAQQAIVKAQATKFLNDHNLDYSTFQSQYKAQNDVLQQNVERAANTKVFAGEVAGSADALMSVIDSKDLQALSNSGFLGIGNHTLSAQNIADLALGKQVNNPIAMKYQFQIQAMANDLAGYYAASRGAKTPENADLIAAGKTISNGLNTGSVQAFKDSINTNEEKVTGVVNKAVENAQKAVWSQFGVTKPEQITAGKTGKLSDGTVVTQNADGSITDKQGNKYDQNGNKIK